MQTKEQKICSFTQNNYRLQLVRIFDKYIIANEIINTVGGYEIVWSDCSRTKIPDDQVENLAKKWGMKRSNENYYYQDNAELVKCKYQVRLNRKIIDTSISEYQARKVFATYCQNIVLQLKIY